MLPYERDRLRRHRHVLGRRQVAAEHRVDVLQPSVAIEGRQHLPQQRRIDPLPRHLPVPRMVGEHHRRQRDHVVAERLQRRHRGAEADVAARHLR